MTERARQSRLAASRRANQADRDMVDAIREMLGLQPLFREWASENYGYIFGAMRVHEDAKVPARGNVLE